ncbi:MAG: hypothetical protein ACYDAO_02500 [Thermoplasmataceae archaeon]
MKTDEFLTRINIENAKEVAEFKAIERPFNGAEKVVGLQAYLESRSGNAIVSAFLKSDFFPLNEKFVMPPKTLMNILDVSTKLTIDREKFILKSIGTDGDELEWHLGSVESDDDLLLIESMKANKINKPDVNKFSYTEPISLLESRILKVLKYNEFVKIETFEFRGNGTEIEIFARPEKGKNFVKLFTIPSSLDYHQFYDSSLLTIMKRLSNQTVTIRLGEKNPKTGNNPPFLISIADADSEINYFVSPIMAPSNLKIIPSAPTTPSTTEDAPEKKGKRQNPEPTPEPIPEPIPEPEHKETESTDDDGSVVESSESGLDDL